MPERLRAIRATPSLFTTLGVGAAMGRTFSDEESVVGRDRVVVLSDSFWRNRFNADPGIVGRDLRLSGETYRVVGVMPPSFLFPTRDVQVFVPYAFTEADKADDARFTGFNQGIGRLAPGATPADVRAQSDLIVRRNMQRISASGGPDGGWYSQIVEANGYTIKATPLREYFAGSRVHELPLIQFAVALVLLIVCANVANLMLVRWSARQKELAVRSVLGANRARIARQLLVEAMLLALLGGALGLGLAVAGGRLVAASGLLPDWVDVRPHASMLATAFVLSLLAGALFGTLPILSRPRASAQGGMLRESGRLASGGRGARITRNALVVTQLALAVALLASAGLLLRSFGKIMQQDPGFSSEGVLTATIALPDAKYHDEAAQARVFQRILDEVRGVPGVEVAGLTTTLPFSGTNAGQMFRIVGRQSEGAQLHAALRRVDEGYFAAMGIPLKSGRTFTRSDWNPNSHDVIVDELFAKKHFPSGNAVGSTLYLGSSGESDVYTIVGVVGTVRHGNLAADVSKETFYFDFGSRAESVGLARGAHEGRAGQPRRAAAAGDPRSRSGSADVRRRDARPARQPVADRAARADAADRPLRGRRTGARRDRHLRRARVRSRPAHQRIRRAHGNRRRRRAHPAPGARRWREARRDRPRCRCRVRIRDRHRAAQPALRRRRDRSAEPHRGAGGARRDRARGVLAARVSRVAHDAGRGAALRMNPRTHS